MFGERAFSEGNLPKEKVLLLGPSANIDECLRAQFFIVMAVFLISALTRWSRSQHTLHKDGALIATPVVSTTRDCDDDSISFYHHIDALEENRLNVRGMFTQKNDAN